MRLFLASYRTGRHQKEFIKLLGKEIKVAFISNAKDYYPAEIRQQRMDENFDYWRSIGVEPTEIDLRSYFHKPGAEKLLKGFKCVWLMGGNVFLLRRALAYTGLDNLIIDKVRKGEIIYGGESAGAMMAGPTLQYSEEGYDEDSPNFVPDGYSPEILWEGLGFVDFVPVPHYRTPDYGEIIDKWIARLDKANLAYKPMTDEQAIIIDGDRQELLP